MRFRFRRSIKIAPGLKLNLNKKIISLTNDSSDSGCPGRYMLPILKVIG